MPSHKKASMQKKTVSLLTNFLTLIHSFDSQFFRLRVWGGIKCTSGLSVRRFFKALKNQKETLEI